jgi:hypothetical protein
MRFFLLSPEVPGASARSKDGVFHVLVDGWFGDDLLESYPSFIITPAGESALDGLTGFDTDAVRYSYSETFLDYEAAGSRLGVFRSSNVLLSAAFPFEMI